MIRALRLDRSGASAAEFALVVPLLILFVLGLIDAGRFIWETNRVEKATQMGARMAVVTQPVSTGLANQDYLGVGGLTQGDVIPASALGTVTCGRTSCSCNGSACPNNANVADSDAFDRIFARMRMMKPDISADEVTVSYRGAGLGYAGDPHGMDISPLVTVELSDVEFRPVTLLFAGGLEFDLPAFRTTLTAEDSAGNQSN
jgi:Flp pilus assembly protein TadG